MGLFRALRADEIDCRISQIKEKDGKPTGLSLLLYKDARCDQNILDETVGPYNWKREHTRDNRNCIVSLWDSEKDQWVSKEDTGTESNTEREKGLASDSFKRACFNWGIGRELYTAPFIWITPDKCNIKRLPNGKWACYDNFLVTGIKSENGVIVGLKIKNNAISKEVFSWGNTQEKPVKPDNDPGEGTDEQEPIKKDNPADVEVTNKLPQKKGNPVQEYVANEITFMKEMFGIADSAEMLEKFKNMRNALIKGGVIKDIPSDKQTMEQAKDMIEAIYANFKPSGDAA